MKFDLKILIFFSSFYYFIDITMKNNPNLRSVIIMFNSIKSIVYILNINWFVDEITKGNIFKVKGHEFESEKLQANNLIIKG